MESGVPPCAACGDDAHAACRACSYALCKACLDEDAAEGRTTCARCGGEYGAPDPGAPARCGLLFCPMRDSIDAGDEVAVLTRLISVTAHGQGAVVEQEVEESHEPAAGGVRERVTMASQLSDHQVNSPLHKLVQFWVEQLERSDVVDNVVWDFVGTG